MFRYRARMVIIVAVMGGRLLIESGMRGRVRRRFYLLEGL